MSEAAALSLCAAPELRDRALMLILFGAGIRDGEARQLRLRDVDLEARTLHVKWKGRQDRLIPLPHRVVHAVAELAVLDGLEGEDHLWYRQKANEYARRVLRERSIVTPASTVVGTNARPRPCRLQEAAHDPAHVRDQVSAGRRQTRTAFTHPRPLERGRHRVLLRAP